MVAYKNMNSSQKYLSKVIIVSYVIIYSGSCYFFWPYLERDKYFKWSDFSIF